MLHPRTSPGMKFLNSNSRSLYGTRIFNFGGVHQDAPRDSSNGSGHRGSCVVDRAHNIWAFPTDGSPARQLTDFGQRPILIARQVSWSPDGKFVYAAVVETDVATDRLDSARIRLPRSGSVS